MFAWCRFEQKGRALITLVREHGELTVLAPSISHYPNLKAAGIVFVGLPGQELLGNRATILRTFA